MARSGGPRDGPIDVAWAAILGVGTFVGLASPAWRAEIAPLLVAWLVGVGVVFAVIAADEHRAAPEVLARAWPPASRAAAVVLLGVLALPLHFVRTRRGLRGVAPGLAWGAIVVALDVAVEALLGV